MRCIDRQRNAANVGTQTFAGSLEIRKLKTEKSPETIAKRVRARLNTTNAFPIQADDNHGWMPMMPTMPTMMM